MKTFRLKARKEMKVWTEIYHYRPFLVGGNVHSSRLVSAKVPVYGPISLAKNYAAYIAESPFGERYVVEAVTGAIIGKESELSIIRRNIVQATKSSLAQQLESELVRAKKAVRLGARAFWTMFLP